MEIKESRELTSVLVALIFGAILLVPSIKNIIEPPFVWVPMLLSFYVTAIVAIIFLAFAFYLTFSAGKDSAYKPQSTGAQISLFAYLFLMLFIGKNLLQDIYSLPEFEDVTVSNYSPAIGSTIKFTAQVKYTKLMRASVSWSINGENYENTKFVYYSVPLETEEVVVVVKVSANQIWGSDVVGQTKKIILPVNIKSKGSEENAEL